MSSGNQRSELEIRKRRILAEPFKTLTPQSSSFSGGIREIWSRRTLLILLIRRELKIRYKDSLFGLLWSLSRPIMLLVVYYFAIGQILGAARGIDQFAIFIFVGFATWTLFADIVTNSTTSILDNAGLIKKIYLPRELFPLSSIGGALFNFFIYMVVFIIGSLILRQSPVTGYFWHGIVAFAIVLVYAAALGLLFAGLNVYFRDIQHLTEVALLIGFWISPVVYSYSKVADLLRGNWLEQLYLLNPMTTATLGIRQALWSAGASEHWPSDMPWRLLITLVVGLGFLYLAHRVFSRLQISLAQEI